MLQLMWSKLGFQPVEIGVILIIIIIILVDTFLEGYIDEGFSSFSIKLDEQEVIAFCVFTLYQGAICAQVLPVPWCYLCTIAPCAQLLPVP